MILWKIQLGSNPGECKCEFNCDYRGRCTYVWQRTRLCQLRTLVSVVFSHLLRSIAIIFKSEPNFFTKFLAAAVKSAMHVISDATCDIIDFVNIIVKITILNYGKLICRNLILKQVHFFIYLSK